MIAALQQPDLSDVRAPAESIDRLSLAEDPQLLERLADLDRGLVDGDLRSECATPPPLAARLVLPMDLRSEVPAVRNHAGESIRPAAINSWAVSAALVLLMFAGAAGAALAFHERLSYIVAHWETRLN